MAVLVAGLGSASAFVPIGPNNEAYQDPSIGYNPNPRIGDTLETGPKAIGEEYRRNIPVLYYSYDQNFIEYFGSNGMAAIDSAIAILNGLTNVSSYSADLSEIPIEASRVNSFAGALGINDLKSYALHSMMEQLGLADVDRYVWNIHGREHVGTVPCPAGQLYSIVKRNIDPVTSGPNQFQYSSYVNGTLLTYQIVEYCNAGDSPIDPAVADAREFQVDPLSPRYSAVASKGARARSGAYYTGLTRDDVGGLRYLLRANNLNIEGAGANTVTFVTNSATELIYTSNLTALAEASYTNAAAGLLALFPGLQIASTTEVFTNIVSTNAVFYFTNYPWSPAGSPAILVSGNVVTTNVAIRFKHEFANVITNQYSTSAIVSTVTTNSSTAACAAYPWLPAGMICTVISQNSYVSNGVFGDYYLFPTNGCGVSIVNTQLVQAVTVTGNTAFATNGTAANVGIQFFSQTPTYSFNQYIFQVRTVVCPENTVALRQGIERIQFIRRDYDSLLGTFWQPVSNTYVLNAVTNNTLVPQTVRRTVTQPDFLFSAQDLAAGPDGTAVPILTRNLTFNQDNVLANLAGPGIIETPSDIIFNKAGPAYAHTSPGFLEADQIVAQIWGSFDGSTNMPVVYPNGTSIENLENLIFIQISPTGITLPNGQVGANYTNVFGGFTVSSGATAPYVWTFSPGSGGLPPGLTLGAVTGRISGMPTAQGIYDFSIRMTDATARYVDRPYTITIVP